MFKLIKRIDVIGSQASVPSTEISVHTAFVRSNIRRVVIDGVSYWQYDEIEMSILDYLKQQLPINQEISDQSFAEITTVLADYQKQVDQAIGELSILIGGV